jgi:hypothetical protein
MRRYTNRDGSHVQEKNCRPLLKRYRLKIDDAAALVDHWCKACVRLCARNQLTARHRSWWYPAELKNPLPERLAVENCTLSPSGLVAICIVVMPSGPYPAKR